ncbi:uncharacterized protein CcaverHIS019_0202020 [Cutaneotrichosporon cavernicola]|uniref:F-box domain-containing protein n=1 Tax=Cutaneotrichosporon cavernicola TaxID=279322 RepID=A0AA48I6M9_9TREE|nr:uncharacterized protein CcaverHIS019_0202020 [Cutaneotrichosporon cavernicola]BEI88840.1 hypothetical protein CcaverHIS019_0202020 [Cutaneotrichosporon cavernicola]BEJ04387.1 hypothetical protein CcaverHIS641_0202040 [Cutaneotrichosporon cavernicola]
MRPPRPRTYGPQEHMHFPDKKNIAISPFDLPDEEAWDVVPQDGSAPRIHPASPGACSIHSVSVGGCEPLIPKLPCMCDINSIYPGQTIAGRLPHIVHKKVVNHLGSKDLIEAVFVNAEWRREATPLVVRHMHVNPGDLIHPLKIFDTHGKHVAMQVVGDDQTLISTTIDKYNLVVDLEDTNLNPCRPINGFVVYFSNTLILRRHGRSTYPIRAPTIVDFDAPSLQGDAFRGEVRCVRYVVPNIAYMRDHWSLHKISKLKRTHYQSIPAVSFSHLQGIDRETPREIVFMFLEDEPAELDEAFPLVKKGLSLMMVYSRPLPKITFVGLRPNDRRGDTLEEQLEEYIPLTWTIAAAFSPDSLCIIAD